MSRLAIAAGVAAFIAVGGGGFLLGRATAPRPDPPFTPPPLVQPTLSPPAAPAPRVWGRAEIIDLAARAADAFASGEPLGDGVTSAVGQRFDLALPFGCAAAGAEHSADPMRWRYDDAAGVLRLHVMPIIWQGADWDLAKDGDPLSARGFWIERPWSSSGECPSQQTDGDAPAPPEQTLALAQFTQSGRSDLWRNDRPFQKILRIAPEDIDTSRGFRLRLVGRIDQVPGDGPVKCRQPQGAEQRPVCVVAVTLREVRLERPDDGVPLAIWEDRSSIGAARTE